MHNSTSRTLDSPNRLVAVRSRSSMTRGRLPRLLRERSSSMMPPRILGWVACITAFALSAAAYPIGKYQKVWSPGTPADAPFGGQKYAFERGKQFNQFSANVTKLLASGVPLDEAKGRMYAEVRNSFTAFLDARKPGQPFLY